MPIIGDLILFSALTDAKAGEVNNNFAAIKLAFNTSAVLTDVAKTIAVEHTFSAGLLVTGGGIRLGSDAPAGTELLRGSGGIRIEGDSTFLNGLALEDGPLVVGVDPDDASAALVRVGGDLLTEELCGNPFTAGRPTWEEGLVWNKVARGGTQALATATVDLSLGQTALLTLAASATLVLSNPVANTDYRIRIYNSSGGNITITRPGAFINDELGAPSLVIAAGKATWLWCWYNGTGYEYVVMGANFDTAS